MSQIVKEIKRLDPLIREFVINSDKDLKCVEIGLFSAVPSINDRHPKNKDLFVEEITIELIDDRKHRVTVLYQPKAHPLPRKEVISIQPGDMVTVTTPYELSAIASNELKFNVAEMLPDGVNVIVLSGGATLKVYREQGYGPIRVSRSDGKREYVCGNCPDCARGKDFDKCPKMDRNQDISDYRQPDDKGIITKHEQGGK